ncbi:MAG: MOSC domain-containing protein [Ilumatobacteraceae bacterium]
MNVSEIWIHPVKSMVGGTVTSVVLDELGAVGDRIWAVRDLDSGGIRGAKKIGGLMRLGARRLDPEARGYDDVVEIEFPDGRRFTSDDPDIDAALSEELGRRVTLQHLRPADDLDHYRRGRPDSDDVMAELRSIFGRDDDEPLPDLGQFPPVIMEFESPPGTYYDCWPLMIMTTSALRSLANAVPDSVIDVRRFRPNFVIDTGDEVGHPEFDWTGRRMAIGTAEIEFIGPCPRCVMVTRAVNDDVPEDRAVLRHIVRDLDQNVGAYARITKPGTFSVGDSAVLLT